MTDAGVNSINARSLPFVISSRLSQAPGGDVTLGRFDVPELNASQSLAFTERRHYERSSRQN
jgi:hypothetical protein